jgi:hypothetical protein
MAQTAPPTIDPAPSPAPQRNDRNTFSARLDAFVTWIIAAVAQFAALALNVYNNAVDAFNSATAAANSSAAAAASAAASATASGATMFNPATTYTQGQPAISGLDFQVYRRKTAGSSATDPKNDPTNWAPSVIGIGVGGASSSGNTTLVAASAGAQRITTTAPGQRVTLPDATTCQKHSAYFNVFNAGEYDLAVCNNGGQVKGFVRPFTNVVVGLADNSTANGLWNLNGAQAVGVTAQRELTSTPSGSGDYGYSVQLDTNRTLFVFGQTAVYAQVFDRSTQTWGSVATVFSSNIVGGHFRAVLAGTNLAMVAALSDSGNPVRVVTLSVSGTTITVNTAVTHATGVGSSAQMQDLVAVGSAWVLMWYDANGGTNRLFAITVSGTVPTLGAGVVPGSPGFVGTLAVASASVVLAFTNASTYVATQAWSLSGTTLTSGTTDTAAASSSTNLYRVLALSNGRFLAMLIKSSSALYARLYSVSGSTVTSTEVQVGNTNGPSSTLCDWLAVASNKVVIAWSNNDSIVKANVITDTSGTISLGTESSFTLSNTETLTSVAAVNVSGSVCKFACTTANTLGLMSVDGSGASPTVSMLQRLPIATNGAVSVARPQSSNIKSQRTAGDLSNGTLTVSCASYLGQLNAQLMIGDRMNLVDKPPMAAGLPNAYGQNGREGWVVKSGGATIQLLEMTA